MTMRFDILTLFPNFFSGPLDHGILSRAIATGSVQVALHDLRDFTHDRHRTVDDRPFGGGEGMVLKPQPIFDCVESLDIFSTTLSSHKSVHLIDNDISASNSLDTETAPTIQPKSIRDTSRQSVILLSAQGKHFTQATAHRLAALEQVVLICGRYEGVDERVAEHLATDELCVGDFVLSGGELPAATIVDAVTRLIPGALGNEDSAVNESFSEAIFGSGAKAPGGEAVLSRLKPRPTNRASADEQAFADAQAAAADNPSANSSHSPPVTDPFSLARGDRLLDCPHYTRPPSFRGWSVPEVLLGGNHEEIRRWRRQKALEKTLRNRPDLLNGAAASSPQAR